jgi:transglutaminase-like putative cysteine protease
MYRNHHTLFCAVVALGLLAPALATAQGSSAPPRSREFQFTYGATVTKLKPGQMAKVWIPIPPNNEHQQITIVKKSLPGVVKQTREDTYGNEFFYVEAKANDKGEIPLEVTYKVKRLEVLGGAKANNVSDELIQRFLQPDARVPISGKPLMLVEGKKLPADEVKLGKTLFDVVNDHMTYSKHGSGWGQGDAVWACDSKYGNCTDFHSLFISLTRAHKVPAKFVMGFGIPEKRGAGTVGGYHCWAWFKPKGQKWTPVDISQANQVKKDNPKLAEYLFGNLTEDRVVFTTGRDINLVPRQAGAPLNFVIYPYVEAGGEAYPQENVQKRFAYQDTGA